MSLDSIIQHILKEANLESQKIIQEAKAQAEKILQEAQQKASQLYQQIIEKAKKSAQAEKEKLIVNTRLSIKKEILTVKQELIDNVFGQIKSDIQKDKLKKQVVFIDRIQDDLEEVDFYLDNLRTEYEGEIAKILFT